MTSPLLANLLAKLSFLTFLAIFNEKIKICAHLELCLQAIDNDTDD